MTYIEPTWPYAQIDREDRTPASIEVSRNAKHEPSWSIKIYSKVGEEEQALANVLRLDAQLREELWKD